MANSVNYSIINANNNEIVQTGNAIVTLLPENNAITKTSSYLVGTNVNYFELSVNYDPIASGSYKVRLNKINYVLTDSVIATKSKNVSAQNIETDIISISN